MALDFPQNPAIEDIHTDETANTTWKFDGLAWNVISQDQTLTLTAGNNIVITGEYPDYTIAGTVTLPNNFGQISVSGQDTVSANLPTDTLTLIAGNNISITTDNVTNSVTIVGTVEDTGIDFTAFGVSVNSPSGSGNLTYNNAGTFSYTPPAIPDTTNFLTNADISVTVIDASSPVEGGFLFYNSDNGTFTYTRADTYSKLDKTAISVTTNPASGNGSLVHDSLNPGSFTFTPADNDSKLDKTAISVTTNPASGSGSLVHDSLNPGSFTFTPADVSSGITTGKAIAMSIVFGY